MTPKYISVETEGAVTTVTLIRDNVRNAVNEEMLAEIETAFRTPPKGTRCFVLAAKGSHFCAGLDLREHYEKDRSPTCTMIYGDDGGATGWLVGEENRGLACMFTMMNNARLLVGVQGVALAERATQRPPKWHAVQRWRRKPSQMRGTSWK